MLKNPIKPDFRIAFALGLIVAAASYFGFFSTPSSYITRQGCQAAGGQIQGNKCSLNDVSLDIKD